MSLPIDRQPTLNLRHLTAALAIQRLGSISRAADSVHLSQSAITQGLAKLEREVGAELFTRSAAGLFVTAVGKIFLHRAERAMDWLVQIDTLLSGRKRHSRHLARLLSTTQLRAFISVVEHGSYTLAANQLELTQPTVHRAVREIESLCRQRFFQRSPFGVEPFWQARQLARYASLFFAELQQGVDEVREQQGLMAGSLRIGSLPLARTQLVPHAVTRLLRAFPDAHISIIDGPYDEQLHGLMHGKLDVIVGALRDPIPSPDIQQELLFRDPLHIVVRPKHSLATRSAKNARELHTLEWIAPRRNTPAREVFTRFFSSKGLAPPERVIECSSLAAIRSLLLESDRAALLPAKQVALDVKMGILAVSPQRLPGTSREIGLTLLKGWQPTRLQQHFLELLRDNSKGERR